MSMWTLGIVIGVAVGSSDIILTSDDKDVSYICRSYDTSLAILGLSKTMLSTIDAEGVLPDNANFLKVLSIDPPICLYYFTYGNRFDFGRFVVIFESSFPNNVVIQGIVPID